MSKSDLFGEPLRKFSNYVFALIAVAGAVVVSQLLGSALRYTPTVFFFAVIFSSWFGGLWPGIFAGLLSALALDFYFIPPLYGLGISLQEAPDMIAFLTSALLVSWSSGEQKRMRNSVRHLHRKPAPVVQNWTGQFEQPSDWRQSERQKIEDAQELVPEAKVQTPPPDKMEAMSLDSIGTLHSHEESAFLRQGDYWTIQYQGQVLHLRATRGMHCLASLLGHPGREFHVCELLAAVAEGRVPAALRLAGDHLKDDGNQMRISGFQDAGPLLDARAKAECALRLAELRGEMEEANRLYDPERAARAQQEIDFIADHLARTVGLGGRTRRTASQAERARSTVTKRIKQSITKITDAMPSLGHHFAAKIKTGYFCSYNPDPDDRVRWKVRP